MQAEVIDLIKNSTFLGDSEKEKYLKKLGQMSEDEMAQFAETLIDGEKEVAAFKKEEAETQEAMEAEFVASLKGRSGELKSEYQMAAEGEDQAAAASALEELSMLDGLETA